MSEPDSPTLDLTGSCLCGAVKLKAQAEKPSVGVCHCSSCRTWTGSPMMAIDCGTSVAFESEEKVSVYNSSDWAERGFCASCGSSLFYRLKDSGQMIMPVGLFEEGAELHFDHQIFIDEKPNYYDFANETHNMTGAEVFAAYGADTD